MTSPLRTPTHQEISPARLAQLALDLDDAAEGASGRPLEHETIALLAERQGIPVSHYYAAAPLTDVSLSQAQPAKIDFCVGACQRWGALECIDSAAARLAQLKAEGKPGFNIAVRQCLDKCERAAVCRITTQDGTCFLTETTAETLAATLSELEAGLSES
jgi:hypothetical protein